MSGNYLADGNDLTAIANAIRIKGGTSNSLEFPTEFISAINAISTGDGSITINNQSKTITPSESTITVSYDVGYTGLDKVIVNGITATYVGSGVTQRTSSDLTVSGATITAPAGYYVSAATKTIATGSLGTPTATKGTVSNHTISITPSVTNVTGYITGGTKTGTSITVSASELVSGSLPITSNNTYDVTQYASAVVNVPTQDNSFIITVSWDDDYFDVNDGAWVPDCTYSEIATAASTGKTIIMTAPSTENATADCFWDDDSSIFVYCVFGRPDSVSVVQIIYVLTEESLEIDYYNEITQPTGTINIKASGNTDVTQYAIASVPNAQYDLGKESEYFTQNSQRKWRFRSTYEGWDAGWITSGTKYGTYFTFNAVAANITITPSTSVQTIGGADYMMEGAVTVAAIPTGTAGTPTATKGSVSNHSVSVTPSVTNTTGYITGGTKTGTAVTVSASELVSGSETKTANGTYDVTNLAELVVNVSGGGDSGDLMIATTTSTPATASRTITFTGLSGEPTSFHIVCQEDLATASQAKVAAVAYDGTDYTGQTVTNTSNAQASFDDGFSHTYSNGTLTVTATTAYFQAEEYALCYTYSGSSANIGTKDVQVGSGATSITFTGLSDEPSCWSCVFTSNFSTSSGYQRVITVVNNGTNTYGLEMDSAAHYSNQHWTSNYSNGSLTITSQGTNAGGYFHQPGNYHLTYAVGGTQEIEVEPLTVTANGTYSESGKAYSPVTVNVSASGSTSIAQTTWSNTSTATVSHQFTGLSGTPKFAVLRCTSQLTRSSSNTYYYIADIIWDGTNAWGNYHLRSNGTFNDVTKTATSGFNVTTGTNSITFSSDATSRSSAPGSFFNGTYELTYVY